MSREVIYRQIDAVREQQDRIHGGEEHDKNNNYLDWIAVLVKHTGKAVHHPWTVEQFRHQMLKVASSAIAAIEWCDNFFTSESDKP